MPPTSAAPSGAASSRCTRARAPSSGRRTRSRASRGSSARTPAASQRWGPAGAAIWGTPTVDPKRRLVYVATGNMYTEPQQPTSDAVMAFTLDAGKIAWTNQVTPQDVFVVGCGPRGGANCPPSDGLGPDFDFGNPPMLVTRRRPRSHRHRSEVRHRLGARPRQAGSGGLAVPRRARQRAGRHGVGLGGRRGARLLPGRRHEWPPGRATARRSPRQRASASGWPRRPQQRAANGVRAAARPPFWRRSR